MNINLYIFIFFCSFSTICFLFTEFVSFFCCFFYCNCDECCDEIQKFFGSICEKEKEGNNNDYNKTNEIIINNINNIKNEELPPNSEETRINDKLNNINNISYDDNKNPSEIIPYNPIGENAEMYKPKILQGQKILIVMTLTGDSCNIKKLYNNDKNKTVKEAVEHYGITIVSVDNYNDAINELKKDQKGKCPYYACWLINDKEEKEKMKDFLQILYKFWKNGGAVVLFSDNEPFILETNQFLSLINAGFTMNGEYIGEKFIYGDDTGELNKVGVFNRNEEVYKYENIQRQKLSHNLYKIYEGVTISSVSKNGKRQLDVKYEDIYPFIPFARDSEGGITSLFKLANKEEGDIIIDGGFTKLFINMEEDGTFRYV